METDSEVVYSEDNDKEFKSYYVVWKRIKFNNAKFPYYV